MTAPQLSIDFGTSRCKMAWFNPQTNQAEILRNAEGETETPSLVGFEGEEVLVGKAALTLLEHPETAMNVILSVKRDLGRNLRYPVPGNPTPVEVATHILAKLKRDAEEGHFHQPVTRVVLTHPAAFDQVERDRLKQAATQAGFSEVEMLPEPVAAAMAYAHAGFLVGEHVLVYDLGAGTFDLALLTRQEEGTGYRLALDPMGARLGGDDFDRALYDLCNLIALTTLNQPISPSGQIDGAFLYECRQRKENLSLTGATTFRSYLSDGAGGVQLFRHEVKREAFEATIRSLVEQTVRQTESLLRQAENTNYAVESLLLIGGSSRIPLVASMLSEHLSIVAQKWEKQDIAVALGAAYAGQSDALQTKEQEPVSESKSASLPVSVSMEAIDRPDQSNDKEMQADLLLANQVEKLGGSLRAEKEGEKRNILYLTAGKECADNLRSILSLCADQVTTLILGEDYRDEWWRDRHIEALRQLRYLTSIEINDCARLTDEALISLSTMQSLESIHIGDLRSENLTFKGLKKLRKLPRLGYLRLPTIWAYSLRYNEEEEVFEALYAAMPNTRIECKSFDGTDIP